jgi:hypothetical protein
VFALAVALAVGLEGPAASAPGERPRDPRSLALLRENCVSPLARQEVTLFANGTLRLRHGAPEAPEMALHELDREVLDRYLERLAELDLAEAESVARGPAGEWIERCTLELERPGRAPERFEYERLAAGSFALERVRRLVEDLLDELRPALGSSEIPADYEPEIGDRLARADGALFEIVGFTLDGRGVELLGLDQPLTLFVERDQLRAQFARIAARAADRQ